MSTQDAKTLAKSRENEMARISADDDTTARVIESMVLRGDISGLGPEDRSRFYIQMCDSLGLSAASQPFAILRLNGKEILYPTRGATDQLAAIHRLNREIVDGPKVIDVAGTKLVYASCRASHPNGRVETAVATVPATDLVNALMKCETKAKRRATLSILGLGMLDETELETIPASVPRAHVETPSPSLASRFAVVPAVKQLAADLGAIEIPAEAVSVWIKHRTDIVKIDADAREYAWKLTCERVETIAKMSNAKVWLKRAIAEEDARRNASSGDEVIVDAETVSAAPVRAPAPSSADVEAEAERRYQSGPQTPQAPAAEGRDPKTAPSYQRLLDALVATSTPEEVVAAWIAYGGKLAGDGSDVLEVGRAETYKAWTANGGEPGEAALRGAIDRARAAKQADAAPVDTKSRSKSRKTAAAPLAKSIDHPTVAQWDARIGRDESAGHIAGGYHKRAELWRASGELARARAVTVDRLCALLGRDESDASRWLDGCAPDRRPERRESETERRQAR
jgi:hypothetical protein